MTNAEQFKKTFGIYAEEFWSYTEKQMLDWINTDVPDINIGDMISRQEAIDLMALAIEDDWEVGYATDRMNELPSVTPKRKRGKWEEKAVSDEKVIDEWQSARCSACGKYHTAPYMYYFDNYNYCPNCGCRMKEGE